MISDPALLRERAYRVRRQAVRMIRAAGMGHVGGDLSAADILVTLYLGVLRVDPKNPQEPHRDRFFMSKGHCTGALYATLAQAGFIRAAELATYMKPLSRLSGHPDRNKVPGVETNTGSLGHGLPVAVGSALAARLTGGGWRAFVLLGDGELQEGSNWEAAMAAAHYELDNLVAVVDRNGFQQGDATERVMHLEPLAEKWRAFGWTVCELDGHDHAALLSALRGVPFQPGRPNLIIAHTHKGHGVSFMHDRAEWHHKVPSDEQVALALAELESEGASPRGEQSLL